MTNDELAKLAATLSEAQRELVLDLSGAWKLCTLDDVRALNAAGITSGRKTSFGAYAVRLTKRGEALRNHLTKETPRD